MTLTVKHSTLTGAAADPTALVDGVAWDASHSLTGAASPSQGGTGVVNNDASTITISGSFGVTFTVSATTSLTLPASGTLTSTANKLSDFAATTSAELKTVISDETGSGALVFANMPTLVTPVIGAATGTSVSLSQAASGTTTGHQYLNKINISGDAVDTTNDWLTAFGVSHTFGGSTVSGFRYGVNTRLILSGSATKTTGAGNLAQPIYSAGIFGFEPSVNDNGTGGAKRSWGMGLNAYVVAGAGATHYDTLCAFSADISTPSGTLPRYRAGVNIMEEGSQSQGTVYDAALGISGISGGQIGFKNAILIGPLLNGGTVPLSTDATILALTGTQTIAKGLDWGTGVTFTGNQVTGVGWTVGNTGYTEVTGGVGVKGTTSGEVFINTSSTGTTGSYNFNLPTSQASAVGQPLISGTATAFGTTPMAWGTLTGSGNFVMDNTPTLITPVLGVASATSVNKVNITAPATSATLTIDNGKTLRASNTLTFTGTDSSSVAFGGGGTIGVVGYASQGQIPGTTTNDSATSGNIGEFKQGVTDGGTSATFTVTIASPGVVTQAGHNYTSTGVGIFVPTTTGALPTGLTASTVYYVIPGSVSGNTFQLATSIANAIAGTAINTTGSQSGTHTGTAWRSLSNNVAADVAAIQLTPGDWWVAGTAYLAAANTTTTSYLTAAISTTSATLPTQPVYFNQYQVTFPSTGIANTPPAPIRRISVSSNTTVYLVVLVGFGVSTYTGAGQISAWRAR